MPNKCYDQVSELSQTREMFVARDGDQECVRVLKKAGGPISIDGKNDNFVMFENDNFVI